MLKILLKKFFSLVKIDLNEELGPHFGTPLRLACSKEGNLAAVHCLVYLGAKINLSGQRYQYTPLHEAARSGQLDTIKYA